MYIWLSENFSKPISKNGEVSRFKLESFENQLQFTAEFVSKVFKDLFFVLIVFITAESMSCIQVKQYILGVNENSACIFHIRWNE